MMKEEKVTKTIMVAPVNPEFIERHIYLIRGKKVMLDHDLAYLYDVATGHLNRAIKRNASRFPNDFMFQLAEDEVENLKCHFGISSDHGGRRYLPHVFTEHGVVMLSSVLKSGRAIEMNISIVRAFIKLREMLATHKDLAQKMAELERQQKSHSQHLVNIYGTLKKLTNEPTKGEGKIGFNVGKQYNN